MPHTSYIPDMTSEELKELGQSIYDWINGFYKEAETQEKSEGEWAGLDCMEMELDTIVDELFIRQNSWFLERHAPKKNADEDKWYGTEDYYPSC